VFTYACSEVDGGPRCFCIEGAGVMLEIDASSVCGWPEPISAEPSNGDGCDLKDELDRDVEPNGELRRAVDLAGSGPGGLPFVGSLGSSDDVDVFVVHDFDLPFTSIDPRTRATTRTEVVFDADSGSQVCVFLSCATGVTSRPDVHGCDDADGPKDGSTDAGTDGDVTAAPVTAAHLQEGMLGCCHHGSGSMIVGITCDNTEPVLGGFVTIESIGDGACNQNYSVSMSLVD
jgi:hypothetical protein